MSENLTQGFYELRIKMAESFVNDFLAGTKKYNKKQKLIIRRIKTRLEIDEFNMSDPRHQQLFIQEYANMIFRSDLKSSINSIKSDLSKNPQDTLIVDLLGFSDPVKTYIKSEISAHITSKNITGHKAQNIVWID